MYNFVRNYSLTLLPIQYGFRKAFIVSNYVSNYTKVNVEQTTTFTIRIHSAFKQHSIGNSISNTNHIHSRRIYGAS